MLAGLAGAGVAAFLFGLLITAYAYVTSESPRDLWAPSLLEEMTRSLLLVVLALPIWVPVGIAAGAGLGHIVGPRPVGRLAIAAVAISGALLVTVATLLPMLAARDNRLAFGIPVISGLVGGALAAMAYRRWSPSGASVTTDVGSLSDIAADRVAEQPVAILDREVSWPKSALVRLFVGVAGPTLLMAWLGDFGIQFLIIALPPLVAIGWAMDLADGLRMSAAAPPWLTPRRIGLAIAGGLVVVALLTGMSNAYPVGVNGSEVHPPVFTDSSPLPGNGWPAWWRAQVGQDGLGDRWEYRPAALLWNARPWAVLVLATLLVEPLTRGVAVCWRRVVTVRG
jgi:hypothetical protein